MNYKKSRRTMIFSFLFIALCLAAGCNHNNPHGKASDVTDYIQGHGNKKLTLLVYMAADNDLESYALENMKAMERADFKNMNVLVLMDRSEDYDETDGNWTDTRLFELEHDDTDGSFIISRRLDCPALGLSSQIPTELDMANPMVLSNFIQFAKKNYRSQQYALIIWGHGTGWRYSNSNAAVRAVALDDKSGNFMSIADMGKALKNQGLAVIGFDTCFGGVFENIYELKEMAAYSVASPGITPFAGWDYQKLLSSLEAGDFSSKSIALCMAQSASAGITVFDNTKLEDAMNALEAFSQGLAQTIVDMPSQTRVFNQLMSIKSYVYTQFPCDRYLDIPSLAAFYSTQGEGRLVQEAQNLKEKISALTVTAGSQNASGVGINFIPMTSPGVTALSHSRDYIKDENLSDQCAFIKESQWWVPTKDRESDSLLNKLFYRSY